MGATIREPGCRRALLSVTDKTGIIPFGKALEEAGVEIVSTGGTFRVLSEAGVRVTKLDEFTGMQEMLDGRVKTLHPKVHAGILSRRDLEQHRTEMEEFGFGYIDLVAVNLYDFASAAKTPGVSFEHTVEQIDIGGPTLLRAAAKNHAHVIPVVDPSDYGMIAESITGDGLEVSERRQLAAKVYAHTAKYDAAIAAWFMGQGASPSSLSLVFEAGQRLRYGENPHQQGVAYTAPGTRSILDVDQLQGKALSYNNLLDSDAAIGVVDELWDTAAVFVKHNNPCGVSIGKQLAQVVASARNCDAVSAFGAVVAVNATVDKETAEVLGESFLEVLIAPGFTNEARELLSSKKKLCLLQRNEEKAGAEWTFRSVRGGVLSQTSEVSGQASEEVEKAQVVTDRAPTTAELRGLKLAWVAAKHVRSNAIVFSHADRLAAVGAGQMSRVDSVNICKLKAGERLQGTAVASDAFFPFRDGVDVVASTGATAIVQPGGSIRDEEVIRAANEQGLAMVFTGVRHFRH